jgi:sugar lactone lactonase YvrE
MRMRDAKYAVAATIAACFLTDCGGSTAPAAPIAGSQDQARTIKHDARSCPCLYVSNWYGESITVYPLGADGNVTPIQTIAGASTGIDLPDDLALDASANIYVTNFDDNSVTIYAAGATGNVAPTATIIGPQTLLFDPQGISVDPINGDIYVGNLDGPSGSPSILIFSPISNGNVAPIGLIEGSKTDLQDPDGIVLDASGNIYVSDDDNYIDVYPAGATGNVAPARRIKGALTKLATPLGLALDSSSNVYVANNEYNNLTVYSSGAGGNVAPIQLIKGGKTRLTNLHGVAVDSSDNIYATNGGEPRSCPDCSFVAVYASGATGNVAPIKGIRGSKTGLDGPSGIAIR